ncbi:hypothetical protein B5X24_HaOG206940 [Helicoverpa armigera]|nr:hypothetical protein B5X24_HaOG206940 [Helicoverpa armigera]
MVALRGYETHFLKQLGLTNIFRQEDQAIRQLALTMNWACVMCGQEASAHGSLPRRLGCRSSPPPPSEPR